MLVLRAEKAVFAPRNGPVRELFLSELMFIRRFSGFTPLCPHTELFLYHCHKSIVPNGNTFRPPALSGKFCDRIGLLHPDPVCAFELLHGRYEEKTHETPMIYRTDNPRGTTAKDLRLTPMNLPCGCSSCSLAGWVTFYAFCFCLRLDRPRPLGTLLMSGVFVPRRACLTCCEKLTSMKYLAGYK
jgi:hypothetical protein